jgi:hypothetical protein
MGFALRETSSMGRFGKWLIVASLPASTAAAAGAQDDIRNRMKRRAAMAVDTDCRGHPRISH